MVVLIAAACGSSSTGPGGRTACSPPLAIGPTTFSEGAGNTIDVTYTASVTGDGLVSSLTYTGPSGDVTVNNPAMPYSIDVNVPLPNQAAMSAAASFNNGTITIGYQAEVGGGDEEQGNQTCGGSNN
jgi:hypothetical protein